MNFVENKANSASYDGSFRRNLIESVERCVLHFPEKNEFTDFLGELSQITFLKSEDILEENERNILKTFYRNNDKPFLVCYQLWLKFWSQVFLFRNFNNKICKLYRLK